MGICDEWSMVPLSFCTYGSVCAAISIVLILMNLIFILKFLNPYGYFLSTPQYRSGYLPFLFSLCILLNIFIVFIPLVYMIVAKHVWDMNTALLIFLHASYWISVFLLRILTRNYYDTPIVIVFNDFLAIALLVITPSFNFKRWFSTSWPEIGLSQMRILLYCLEGFSLLFIFFCVITKQILRVQTFSNTPWSRYTQKVSQMAPFVWPKNQIYLQLRILICFLILGFGRLINILLPLYNKWIVDDLSQPNSSIYKLIIISCVLKFCQGGGVTGGFIYNLRSYIWIPVQQYSTYNIQVKVFEHLHNLSLRWHILRKTGQVLRILDRGTSSMDSIMSYILFTAFPTIADIVIATLFFFAIFNVYFGFLIFIIMVIYIVITIFLTEWRTKFRREMNDTDNSARSIGVDSLLNYEAVKYYSAEELESKRFSDSIKIYQKAEWKSLATLSMLNSCQSAVIGVGLALGSVLVAYLILSGQKLTSGDYVLFMTYMMQLYVPLNFFGTIYRVLQQAFIDMENLFELLADEVEIFDKENVHPLVINDGTIVLKNVSFGYSQETTVLHDVSFSVSCGQTIAIVGPSGAGKSTIIRLLFRLYDVSDGQVLFDGQDIRDVAIKSVRRQIGIVPQDTVLFNETIRYNIRYGNPNASNQEVEDAARAAEIHERILSFPEGYETIVGERGLKLSGGEKQRVAIARTILKNPHYILLDEATSALDTSTERSIQKCFADICKNRATIIVAHRLSTINHANQIYVLDNGRIIENGTHSELISRKGKYAQMWEAQSIESNEETQS